MKKRKVEAWAVVAADGEVMDVSDHDPTGRESHSDTPLPKDWQLVRLIEVDPAAEAELRDLRKLAQLCGESSEWRSRDAHLDAIYAEVERQKRKGKR